MSLSSLSALTPNSSLTAVTLPQTYLIMPNVLDSFASLDCGTNVYWGNSFLCAHEFPFHFGGLAYALSWPLIKWIGTTRLTPEQIRGNEDARTGSWCVHLASCEDGRHEMADFLRHFPCLLAGYKTSI